MKMYLPKCHAFHCKVSVNGKLKVTVTIPPESSQTFLTLAKEFSNGCLADFIAEISQMWCKDFLKAEKTQLEEERAEKAKAQPIAELGNGEPQQEEK